MSTWLRCFPLLVLVSACGAPAPSDNQASAVDDDSIDESDEALESGDRCRPRLPRRGVYATFDVNGEVFHSLITSAAGIQQAIDLWQGRSQANIPVGRLACTRRRWNCPYTWHQIPRTVEFAEFATEVCDGLPSFVEDDCANFGAGSYCPFSAQLTKLQDCRTSPSCPVVPR